MKKLFLKITIIISLAILTTIVFGPIHFIEKTTFHSPYDNIENKDQIEKINNFNTTLLPNMEHYSDYPVLNGGGTKIVGATRVFKMKKADFSNISFNDYIDWTKNNFEKYDCKTIETLKQDNICQLKGFILFEDETAIRYIDGVNSYVEVHLENYNYLNGYSQEIIHTNQDELSDSPFFYLSPEEYEDYTVISSYENNTTLDFEKFKETIK